MSFSVYNTIVDETVDECLYYLRYPPRAVLQVLGTTDQINVTPSTGVGNVTLSLANPINSLNVSNFSIPTTGSFKFNGGIQAPVVSYVLTCTNVDGTVQWAPGGTVGSTFPNITVVNVADLQGTTNLNNANFLHSATLTQNQVLALDNTANKNVISIPYTSVNTASTIVTRDGTGNFSAGTGTFTNLIDTGLTASQAVVTNGTNQLVSLPYSSANVVSSLVERDGTGSFSAGTVTTSGFVLTTGAINNYVLTSNAGGTATWQAIGAGGGAVTSLTGTTNQIAVSAPTGAVTLSLPTTVDVTTLNVSSLTASQAVVTDGTKNLVSLPYSSANTATSLVERDGTGSFSAGTVTTTGFALTTGATNGYVLTSNAGGTASWQSAAASGAITTINGTINQISASPPVAGAVTLSLPTTVDMTNVVVTTNIISNNEATSVATQTGNFVLNSSSKGLQVCNFTTDATATLPNATTLTPGQRFTFYNNNSFILTINTFASATSWSVPGFGYVKLDLITNGTTDGVWVLSSNAIAPFIFSYITTYPGLALAFANATTNSTINIGYALTGTLAALTLATGISNCSIQSLGQCVVSGVNITFNQNYQIQIDNLFFDNSISAVTFNFNFNAAVPTTITFNRCTFTSCIFNVSALTSLVAGVRFNNCFFLNATTPNTFNLASGSATCSFNNCVMNFDNTLPVFSYTDATSKSPLFNGCTGVTYTANYQVLIDNTGPVYATLPVIFSKNSSRVTINLDFSGWTTVTALVGSAYQFLRTPNPVNDTNYGNRVWFPPIHTVSVSSNGCYLNNSGSYGNFQGYTININPDSTIWIYNSSNSYSANRVYLPSYSTNLAGTVYTGTVSTQQYNV